MLKHTTETLNSPSVASDVESPLGPGDRVGRFVLERVLGSGGMGVVFAAQDPDLERIVAIKVLRAAPEDRLRQERLIREARTLARIDHTNVVAVHEVGEQDGRFFIVMELCDGLSLRAWLQAEPRGVPAVLEVFLGAARGIAVAHENKIVHRDFKPENVIVDASGRARVVDFGIADAPSSGDPAAVGPEALSLTLTQDAIGTPAYMAPEQLRGESVDAQCDQYSFCLSLYEALRGKRLERHR